MAPQPACVTGPRHGVPRVTMTQTVPRRLQSGHTLSARVRGRRPATNAVITSSNWRRSIGQPRNSKSTLTWSEIAVEVASDRIYSGLAYTARKNSE